MESMESRHTEAQFQVADGLGHYSLALRESSVMCSVRNALDLAVVESYLLSSAAIIRFSATTR